MKKRFTLILASMLLTMGAWAEVLLPTVSDGTAMHYYRIKSLRTGKYAAYTGDNTQLAQMADPTIECIWYVTADGENYKLHNLATENVYAGVSSFTSTGVTVYIQENPYRAGYVCISTTEDLSSNCWDDQGSGTKIGNYNPRENDNEGTSWTFEKVDAPVAETYTFVLTEEMSGQEFTGEYICYTYEGQKSIPTCVTEMGGELVEPVWNEENNSLTATITFPVPVSSASITNQVIICPFAKDGTNKYFADGTSVKANRNNTMPFATNVAAENYLWAFYPELIDGTTFRFRIKNIGTGTYLSSESTANDHSGDEVSLVSDEANSEAIFFTVTANKQIRNCKGYDLSVNSEANSSAAVQNVGTYNTNHNGTKNKIINANNYTLTDGAGNEYVGTNGVQNLPAIGTYTDGAWGDNGYSATITFPFSVSSAEVTNETMIANFNATQRWHAVGSDVKVQTEVPTVATMDEWMWAIYPTFEEGKFTFKVKNMSTGTYVTVNKNTSSFDTQGTVTLTGEGTELEVITWLGSPCFIVSGSNYVYLTINGTLDTDVFLATWTGGNNSHAGNKLHFPNPTYNVTITDAKAATLTTPFAVSLPTGVTAGYVNGVDTEKQILTYTDVTAIPAGESVVLFGEAGIYTFNKTENAEDFTSENYLVGYNVATDIPEGQTVYALGNKSNGVAFYTFTGTQYAAGKAYLQLPVAEAKAIGYFNVFGGEGTTGIGNAQLTMDNENVVIYDLQGRRVEQMEKGIYIVNGKKIIK